METSENNNICFVISPIGKEDSEDHEKFKEILDYIIKPAIMDSGHDLEVLRADEINKTGSLIRDILENIYSSFVVIADLTGQNPNVFYELGVRHALKSRTILIAQSSDDIPFDLKDYRTITYDTSAKGAIIFKNKLKKFLNEIFENPNRPDNPVLDRLDKIVDHRIMELENENKVLRASKQKNNELRDKIEAISNPPKLNEQYEYVGTRLDRILSIEKYTESSFPYYIPYMNFEIYEIIEGPAAFWFISIGIVGDPITKNGFTLFLSDVRVLMDEISRTKSDKEVIFVLVTNDDLSKEEKLIQEKFNKMKAFIDKKSRDMFSLEIWDKSVLLNKEKKLGIKI